jgi:hypothetical protein
MKKMQVVLMVLVAVFALGAVAVSSASAEITLLAEWLKNGTALTTNLAAIGKGSVELEDSKTPIGAAVVKCEGGSAEGTGGPNGVGEVTKVLNAAGKEVEAGLKGEAFLCKGVKGCEADATETEVWPLSLPVLVSLFLLESTSEPFTVLAYTPGAKNLGLEIKCLALSVLIEDTCSAEDSNGNALNVAGGVEGMGTSFPGLSCTQGGAGSGFATAVAGNLASWANGETLTMSSEGEEG